MMSEPAKKSGTPARRSGLGRSLEPAEQHPKSTASTAKPESGRGKKGKNDATIPLPRPHCRRCEFTPTRSPPTDQAKKERGKKRNTTSRQQGTEVTTFAETHRKHLNDLQVFIIYFLSQRRSKRQPKTAKL
jgi:hypothetical protein